MAGGAGQGFTGTQTLVARTRGDPGAALAAIRQTARELDERIATSRLQTLEDALGPALWPPRMAAVLFGLFGLVGLVLAAVGIYAVTAHAVSRRTRELGIRMALGARRRDVLSLVVREGLLFTALGLALGLAAALAATRALTAFLYGVSPTDLVTLATVSVFLTAVALLACYLPARRASRVDPLEALRYE